MTKMQHPSMKRRGSKQVPRVNVPVTEVLPPQDENLFQESMDEVKPLAREVVPEQLMEDPLIKAEVSKQKTLEKLLLFKRPHYKEVEIDSVKFRLKILNSNENDIVFKRVMGLEKEEQLSKTSLMLLSASVVDADGILIENLYSGTEDIQDPLMRKYYELCQWHSPLIRTLTAAYQNFVQEVEMDYSPNFLDDSEKTITTD